MRLRMQKQRDMILRMLEMIRNIMHIVMVWCNTFAATCSRQDSRYEAGHRSKLSQKLRKEWSAGRTALQEE